MTSKLLEAYIMVVTHSSSWERKILGPVESCLPVNLIGGPFPNTTLKRFMTAVIVNGVLVSEWCFTSLGDTVVEAKTGATLVQPFDVQ